MFTVLSEIPLITINLGNIHLAVYLSQVMYLLVAAFVGFVAECVCGSSHAMRNEMDFRVKWLEITFCRVMFL
jgi:hypothetical protein